MFMINHEGRTVDLPARMEKEGYAQAREVLSISRELMNGEATGILMDEMDTLRLRQEILRRFPNVVSDDEYLELHPVKLPEIKQEPTNELVNEIMTKGEIVKVAKENGIIIDSKKQKEVKANLISYVNGNYKR